MIFTQEAWEEYVAAHPNETHYKWEELHGVMAWACAANALNWKVKKLEAEIAQLKASAAFVRYAPLGSTQNNTGVGAVGAPYPYSNQETK